MDGVKHCGGYAVWTWHAISTDVSHHQYGEECAVQIQVTSSVLMWVFSTGLHILTVSTTDLYLAVNLLNCKMLYFFCFV